MLYLEPSILGELEVQDELNCETDVSDLHHGRCYMSNRMIFPLDNPTKKVIRNRLCILVAGYVGEEMSFGPNLVTTRSKLDFKSGMKLAWEMVSEFGFGDFGPGSFADRSCNSYHNLYSMEKTARHFLADVVGGAR